MSESHAELHKAAERLRAGLIGGDALVERLLIGLLAGGHVLIEGAPGVAKTRAVKLLAQTVDLSFARIQCTPDLMPGDLTGAEVLTPDHAGVVFAPGPVFHELVLVDEINRAPPKVQSALLEAMAERQVTIGGASRPLPDPFMAVATQNPIEHEGVFPLPEAQLDRFLLHVEAGLPGAAAERAILDLVESEARAPAAPPPPLPRAALSAARAATAEVHLSPAIRDYIVRIVTATRPGQGAGQEAGAAVRARIAHPVSPRGTLALAAACRARALLHERDHVLPEDVQALAADALAHRLILSWAAAADGHRPRALIGALLDEIAPL